MSVLDLWDAGQRWLRPSCQQSRKWEVQSVFRAGLFARPIYRKEETERFRPTSTRKPKQNAKHRAESTKNHCVHETNLRMERGRPRHFWENHSLPYEDRDIMTNARQDSEVPARSATIKPTQALWQNFSR